MDISKKSIQELKALAYEQIVQRTQADRNLQLIEQEIVKKAKTSEKPDELEKK